MPKHIFREQGKDPEGVTIGGRAVGVIHHDVPDDEADYLVKNKGFRVVSADFDPQATAGGAAKKAAKPKDEPPAAPATNTPQGAE